MASHQFKALAALAAAAPFTHCAIAQPTLAEVVVTASRIEQRVQDALPSTTLITRRQIEQAQTPDLATLLRRVAGLDIAQGGGAGSVSSTFLRGAESRHTLVLVDGVAVNNLNFGTPALEHLPLADVERIEIVKGNVSSLYGSAAVGGVIQIFTRQPGPTPQASFSVQGGSRGLAHATGSGSVKLPSGTGLRASVEALRDNGFNMIRQDQRPGTNPDRDGYRRRSQSVAVTQDLGADQSVAWTLRDAKGTIGFDSQFGPANQVDESRFHERGASLSGKFRLGDVRVNALASRSEDELDTDLTAFPFFVHSRSDSAQLDAEWQLRPGHRVTAGLEHTRQRLRSDTVYDRTARTQVGGRLGYALDTASHQLQLNVRQDQYSDFGSATTWLAAYGYRLTDAWRVSASASTGFTAPTFNDLYYPFGLGNPDLRPERTKSAEIGLQYAVEGHDLRATLFENRFTDLIASDAFFRRLNIGRARTRGLELAYHGRILGTEIHAGFTRQDPRDLDTDTRLLRRASTLAQVAVAREFGGWQLGGNLRYTGPRDDSGVPSNNRVRMGSFTLLDLTAAYRLSSAWSLFARVENLFDRDYQTIYGYQQAGRGVFAGVKWQPGL